MSGGARLEVLDGGDSIGGTKLLVESGGDRLLVDFGTNYKRMSRFYEEFLRPRPNRGLVDLVEMGLLPRRRGLYREDLFPPYDYPQRDADWPGEAPAAVLLSHGHLDHAGAVAFLDPAIPIVATPLTLALLRAWQEGSTGDLSSEVTYLGRRRPAQERGGSLPGRLLEGDRESPKRSRPFLTVGEPSSGLLGALRRPPVTGRGGFEPLDPRPFDGTVGGIGVEALEVDHSVYGSSAFLLEVDGALVGYTGDLRFAGDRAESTERFVRRLEARRPELLIVEGTRLRGRDEERAALRTTEDDVERNCRRAVEARPGRLVVVDFGPRNVERLRRFRRIALDVGRQLVLTPKDAFLLAILNAADPSIEVDIAPGGMRILEEPTLGPRRSWSIEVERRFAEAAITPDAIARSPGRWILCFSFLDCNDLVDLKREGATEGGLWLYSSSEAHGEEQEFDFERLQNWIRWAGMEQIGFRYLADPESGRPTLSFEHPEDAGHHASGHATEAELVELLRRAAPRRIVPVHTLQPPRRYEELLAARGAEVEVIAPRPDRPIPIG